LKANNLTGYSFVGGGFVITKSWHKLDKRLPQGMRKSLGDHTKVWAFLTRELWGKWEAFILGEVDKPP